MSLEGLHIWIPIESPNLIINMTEKAEGIHLLESSCEENPWVPRMVPREIMGLSWIKEDEVEVMGKDMREGIADGGGVG